ncbi:MAG: hypothetical protein K6V36_16235 [Anaerolineae bacterium]|nr:hypothetical protein [Anaerolineae bacterium]
MREQLRRWARWLRPGLGLKRWALLLAAGVFLAGVGTALVADLGPLAILRGLLVECAWQMGQGERLCRGGVLRACQQLPAIPLPLAKATRPASPV